MKKFTKVLCMFVVLLSMCLVDNPVAMAKQKDLYCAQLNGRYKITANKLTTFCRLEGADYSYKAKKRTFKITSKTKIQKVLPDYSKKTIKGAKRKAIIKKLNKKNETIQFTTSKGKVVFIWLVR